VPPESRVSPEKIANSSAENWPRSSVRGIRIDVAVTNMNKIKKLGLSHYGIKNTRWDA